MNVLITSSGSWDLKCVDTLLLKLLQGRPVGHPPNYLTPKGYKVFSSGQTELKLQ